MSNIDGTIRNLTEFEDLLDDTWMEGETEAEGSRRFSLAQHIVQPGDRRYTRQHSHPHHYRR